ncbi:MAG TPA: putative cytokinetic ring protein SteA [Nocardioidaceae bacterium]|nr:putative cytokinetic ring protein SteA [Nocardioidaceae bacterium]
MRLPTRSRTAGALPGVTGTVRMDRRTGSLMTRLRPGDIAVIDHLDLDRQNAEALVERGVVAVVDASPLISGRYPNLGPEHLASSGVVMVDDVGPAVFARLRDGERARVHDGTVLVGSEEVVSGRALDSEGIVELMQDARGGLSTQLQSLTHNTTEFLRREQGLLLHGQGLPHTTTPIEGRPVVVVVRGFDYREDLRRLRRFVREQRPVLIGVDAGADALLESGHRPDIVVVGKEGLPGSGTTDDQDVTVSLRALHAAGEVLLHTDGADRVTGEERLSRLGVRHRTVASSGMSEDVALLLADVRGASLVVTVGTHATLDEFLDRRRGGLSSTFLTRLRVGPKLVDARGVSQLYAGQVRAWHLALVVLAGLVALGVAVATTPVGAEWWAAAAAALSDLLRWVEGLLP